MGRELKLPPYHQSDQDEITQITNTRNPMPLMARHGSSRNKTSETSTASKHQGV